MVLRLELSLRVEVNMQHPVSHQRHRKLRGRGRRGRLLLLPLQDRNKASLQIEALSWDSQRWENHRCHPWTGPWNPGLKREKRRLVHPGIQGHVKLDRGGRPRKHTDRPLYLPPNRGIRDRQELRQRRRRCGRPKS